MTRRRIRTEDLGTDSKLHALATTEVGWLIEGSSPTKPLVDFPGNPSGPVVARTTVALDAAGIDRAVAARQGVVLHFERGRPDLPIIVGLILAKESPLLDLLLDAPRSTKTERAEQRARMAPALALASAPASASASVPAPVRAGAQGKAVEARLDGKRVVLDADSEVVLRCGDASITLTRDGKILLRGTYVETFSRGVNRIKGGAVKIN